MLYMYQQCEAKPNEAGDNQWQSIVFAKEDSIRLFSAAKEVALNKQRIKSFCSFYHVDEFHQEQSVLLQEKKKIRIKKIMKFLILTYCLFL